VEEELEGKVATAEMVARAAPEAVEAAAALSF